MAEKKTKKKSRPNGGGAAGNGGSSAVPGSPMDVGLLEQLVRLMADNDLNTVDVRDGDKRVILKRGPAVVAMPAGAASYAPPAAGIPASHPTVGGGGGAPGASQPTEVDDDAGLVPILSPMVGTFYTAPKPGERPYVSVGSKVVKDETDVCQIEAMKNFFVQKADVTGTIVRILVDNGQPVQVEQPMFLVKPA